MRFEEIVEKVDNFYERRVRTKEKWLDPASSGYQVSVEYINGFPIIRRYIEEIDKAKGLIKSIEDSYNRMHEKIHLKK